MDRYSMRGRRVLTRHAGGVVLPHERAAGAELAQRADRRARAHAHRPRALLPAAPRLRTRTHHIRTIIIYIICICIISSLSNVTAARCVCFHILRPV